MTDPAIIEAAVRKLNEHAPIFMPMEALVEIATMVVDVVTPLIRAEALRDALLAVEGCPPVDTEEWIEKSVAIAALRAVLTKEQP